MRYKGFYHTDNSDLLIEVITVGYRGSDYMKCKLNITNKRNGIAYESRKNYKIYYRSIEHWKRFKGEI